ncbi:efflux RND transporter permease subunit [Paenibacillus sp. GXUN7292]|uniref:efflux RND transporter permease subunit n=1 Tax=Paenibacillus sp. GXUN7292 TaxID=3422499 RepID=UPI003D7E87F0
MSKLTEWSFRNKAAIALLVFMALVMGVISYFRLPMEFLPAADNPQVMITTIGPGMNGKAMEEQVTNPIEEAVLFVKGKKDIFSTSGDGYGQIIINYDSKTSMKEAKQEVEQALAGVPLPSNVMKPFVVQLNTSMIPISWLVVTFEKGLSEHDKDEQLKNVLAEIKNIEGAGQVVVDGKSNPVVLIEPHTQKLSELGLPVQSLLSILQGRGVSAAISEQIIDGHTANIALYDQIEDIKTLESLPVAPHVSLKDVAFINVSKQQDSITRLNGQDAIMVTISKTAEANAVSVGNAIQDMVADFNKDHTGVEVSIILSTAESIVQSVNSMLQEVLLGALFATIIILVFMRNFKATIITIVSIPLSLGITLYLLHISGVSLNIITLGGVAVAVGRLVDDSIVVIENIYRRLQRESFSISLIKEATKEVASAITSSTLVTVAVFLPMGLLRGSLQDFLLPFALTVAYSLLASLIVALTVVPLLSAVLLKNTVEAPHKGAEWFTHFIRWNLNRKWLPLTLALLLFAGSIGLYVSMPKGALDSSSAEYVDISLQYAGDTPSDDVLLAGERLDSYLTQHASVDWVMMSLGNSAEAAKFGAVSSATNVQFMLHLKKQTNVEQFMAEILALQDQYAGADLFVTATDLMMGGGSSNIFIDIMGENTEQLAQAAEQIVTAIRPVDGVLKVESNQSEQKTVYSYKINATQATGQDTAMQLQSLFNPMPLGEIKIDGHATPVILQPVALAQTESDLKQITLMTEEGPRSIEEVASLVKTQEPSLLYHKEGKPYVRVTVSAEPSLLSKVDQRIKEQMNSVELPEGVKAIVGGASSDQSEDFADLGMTALISIGIVYLIMVLTFKTLRAPLAILISLPLAAIGAVTGLLISGVTPDFTAMFGALMLIGIVVTNAIVLIDRVKQNEQTMSIREAIAEAAATRLRPIVMTALATICAMLPLVFGSHESGSIVSQSLAIVVIGGLAGATVLTLIIVPCVYELMYFRKSAKQRRRQVQDGLTASS